VDGEFSGRVAVVTGSSGIGLGAARKLAALGARVYVCGNNQEHNSNARSATAGQTIEIMDVDVGDEAQVDALVQDLAERVTDVHVLVNAAAIQPYGNIETTTPDNWDAVMRINLKSCYLMSHKLYPWLKGRKDASIIHLASVQGHCNQRDVLAYATSKGAIHALTRAMAVDCARDGVRVNSISPGSIRTPLLEFAARSLTPPGGSMEETLRGFGHSHPVGRVGTVEEVAELVAFLASGRSGFCTGGDYPIDGGLRAQLGV
jgi:NAD(P)-dependent dehydrogenase (short-subunit alcohol dehydrogenase family)